jgi:thiosulfate dehydrogenase [quinone] large subunit
VSGESPWKPEGGVRGSPIGAAAGYGNAQVVSDAEGKGQAMAVSEEQASRPGIVGKVLSGAQESTYTLRIPVVGKEYEVAYHPALLPWLTLGGRLVFGFYFLWGGFAKLFPGTPDSVGIHWGGLAAFKAGELHTFLAFADPNWGLGSVYNEWAKNPTVIDVIAPLVLFGEFFIGITLLLGFLTRVGLLSAAMMMFMFYLATHPANNPFLNEYIFYIGMFATLGALGPGRIFGLDYYLEKTAFVQRRRWLTWFLG